MGESAGKHRKQYVDHPLGESKICLIHGPGHSYDECKVLGDFCVKHAKGKPRRGPAQCVPLFYTPYHFSELQSCKSIISAYFPSFSYLNSARHNFVIELCRALFKYENNIKIG